MLKRTRVPAILLGIAWASLAGSPTGAAPAEATARGDAAPGAGASDRRWPMRLESSAGTVTIHLPQWEAFEGETLTGHAASSIETRGASEPTYGAIQIECRTDTDRVARTLWIAEIRVVRARFPGFAGSLERDLTGAIRKELSERPLVLPLDQLRAGLDAAARDKTLAARLQHAPPRILFRSHPTVKVQYDGQPLLGEVNGSSLMRAINTPFLVVLDPTTKTYYVRGAGRWFSAPDALGPFQDARVVPPDVAALVGTEKGGDPSSRPDLAADSRAADIEIVTATQPTELIWTDGPPTLAPIAGTDLLYVTNTDSDVFLRISMQDHYVLLSGRWYTAATRDGPWTHVPPDRLPADFAKIPPESAKGNVLAHVTGTEAARDAVLDSQAPQVAAIDRQEAERPQVTYDGESTFAPVEGTAVRYAVNTPYSVLDVGGTYYCCYDAVWFEGPTPNGPWTVCVAVPPAIYSLPPSCPLYPVRYVFIYQVTPTMVYYGYLPGYFGYYTYGGVIVYGTGFWYPAWWMRSYYPRPWTYGYAARYHRDHGCWGFHAGVRGYSSWLNICTGYGGWVTGGSYGVHRGGGWWGYGGYRQVNVRADAHPALVNAAPARPIAGREPVRYPVPNFYHRRQEALSTTAGAHADRDRPVRDPRVGRAGTRVDDRSPGVTPGSERQRIPVHGGSADADRSDRGRIVREPFDNRAATRDNDRLPSVTPGVDRGRSPGPVRPADEPRVNRVGGGIQDLHDSRTGSRLDGRSPVVMPEPDRPHEPNPFGRPAGASSSHAPPAIQRLPGGWERTDRNAEAPRSLVAPPSREAPPSVERRRLDVDVSPRIRSDAEIRPPAFPRATEHSPSAPAGASRDTGAARGVDAGRSSGARDNRSTSSDAQDTKDSSRENSKRNNSRR
jgi:hypothetical protein